MNSKPPLIKQERADTCMLACLRMLLAYCGKEVSEAVLIGHTNSEQSGLDPDQLANLARTFGIEATACQLEQEDLIKQIEEKRFPIVLLDRSLLDGEFSIHAVIPFRLSTRFVTVLDPLFGIRRISRRKLAKAHARVGRWAVTWKP